MKMFIAVNTMLALVVIVRLLICRLIGLQWYQIADFPIGMYPISISLYPLLAINLNVFWALGKYDIFHMIKL